MDKLCGLHMVIDSAEDYQRLIAEWLNWRAVSRELGVGRAQAHRIMASFAPADLAEVIVHLDGYDSRPCRFVRRVSLENLMRRRRGNPRWKDTVFQQEMANRRWHRHIEPETPLERGYIAEDEVHLIHI